MPGLEMGEDITKHIRGVCAECDRIEVGGDGAWKVQSLEEGGQIVRAMSSGFELYSDKLKKICPMCQ